MNKSAPLLSIMQVLAVAVVHRLKDFESDWYKYHCFLITAGPAGSCKRSLVETIARTMGFQISLWRAPIPFRWSERHFLVGVSLSNCEESFTEMNAHRAISLHCVCTRKTVHHPTHRNWMPLNSSFIDQNILA